MEYIFDDSGRDHAYIQIKDTVKEKILFKSKSVGASDLFPWDAGKKSATKLYKQEIEMLKSKLYNNK